MSSTYNPNGTVPAPTVAGHTRWGILSSTNTAPITVTFDGATTINDQDTVEIEGHLVNTAANGVWQVSKTTSQVYALNGSTGNGVGGQTGYGIDYSLTPAYTIPGDGDLASSTNLMTPVEGVANLGPFLYRQSGSYRLYAVYDHDMSLGESTAWIDYTALSTSFVAANPVGASAPGLFGFLQGVNPPSPAAQVGDFFEVFMSIQGTCYTASQQTAIGVGVAVDGGSYTQIAPSAFVCYYESPQLPRYFALNFKLGPVTGPWSIFDFAVMVSSVSGSSAEFKGFGLGHILVNHYRPN